MGGVMVRWLLLVGACLVAATQAAAQHRHTALVERVVDGDTVRVRVPAWRGTPVEHIDLRLDGIDAPETEVVLAKCPQELVLGRQATDYLRTMLPVGAGVRFTYLGNDKYFRIDVRLTLPDGRDASQVMLAAGLAQPYTGRGPRPNWCG
jgi:micrococcal nuclease